MRYLAGLGVCMVVLGVFFVLWGAVLPHHGSSVFGYLVGVFAIALGGYFLWGVTWLRKKGYQFSDKTPTDARQRIADESRGVQ